MSREEFLDWDVRKAHVTKRTSPQVVFLGSYFFLVTDNFCQGYGCGDTYENYELHIDAKVNIMKGHSMAITAARFDFSTVPLPRKHLVPLPLNPAKLKDLKELLSGASTTQCHRKPLV
ncbi:hypothetical protein Pcinc_004994 [Petrolisthes cinctipes]|uniref:Uncharacterized protein n=1 Tax=Petrolisthes cinctipes TaxID=88211 RepID=A0AAE1GFZ0_PETCI|nr:hypothetical protein Pcinc_004994 [Petrolisthes cinctipes]